MLARLVACSIAALAALQSQPPFRTGIDLLRLDVSVVDDAGRPVQNLRAEDFEVRVSGQPRKVTTARFFGPDERIRPVSAPPAAFADNTSTPPGRIVVIVVDLESMNAGYGKLVLDTAGQMIDRLGPSDAAGLVLIPGRGIELTREHARVREGLTRLTGFAPKLFQRHVIAVREAEALQRLDSRVMREVVERECRAYEPECPRELRQEANQILVEAERRTQTLLSALATLNTRMQPLEAPKTIVLLSAGLPVLQESVTHFTNLQKRVAETGTMMYVVQLEQPETDASSQRMAGAGSLPRADLAAGLATIASNTGGRLFNSVGKATGVFERIQQELTSSYQLGVELQPEDADGQPHEIAVQLLRPGLTARTRKEFIVASKPRAPRTPVEALAHPTDFVELPLAVSAYSTRGEEPATLKVIFAIEAMADATGLPTYAVSILKDGKPVFETADTTVPGESTRARAVSAAQLSPGVYRFRAAIVDPAGRTGSLDMPLAVGLRQAGALQLSDLFLGTHGDKFVPVSHVSGGAPIVAFLELYTANPAEFEGIDVALELRRAGEDPVLAHGQAKIATTDLERRRVAEGQIQSREQLAAGAYSVSAIVRKGSVPVAKVSRTVVVKAP
jgi:VWFA-related protein